jgi:hypothetical protein
LEVTRRERIQSLIAAPRDLLAAIGEELLDDLSAPAYHGHASPGLPLLLRHDFVEIYGGSGRVSAAAQDLGLVVAPPLDLDASQYCFHMIESGRFGSFLTEPPCTTFSAAAYPASRSYAEPNGFEPGDRGHPLYPSVDFPQPLDFIPCISLGSPSLLDFVDFPWAFISSLPLLCLAWSSCLSGVPCPLFVSHCPRALDFR